MHAHCSKRIGARPDSLSNRLPRNRSNRNAWTIACLRFAMIVTGTVKNSCGSCLHGAFSSTADKLWGETQPVAAATGWAIQPLPLLDWNKRHVFKIFQVTNIDFIPSFVVIFLANRTNSRAYATVLCPSPSVCDVLTLCIVAKWCVLEQKLLLTAYRKSYIRNRLVPKWTTLTFV